MKTKSSRTNFRGTFQMYIAAGSSGTNSGNSPSLIMVLAALPVGMSSMRVMKSRVLLAAGVRFGIGKIKWLGI